MPQTPEGAIKVAAKRIGITHEEYLALLVQGLKYCFACKTWKPRLAYNVDRHRGDGLAARCQECLLAKN